MSSARVVGPDVLRQVKHIELRARRLVNTLFSGQYRAVFRGHGIEFAEVRAYQHGDDFRAIDWNVSARMGSPYVKTFEEERELTLLLVVDRSGSVEFGRPHTKAACAVEIAAVLALAAATKRSRRCGHLLQRYRPCRPAGERAATCLASHPRFTGVRAARAGNQSERSARVRIAAVAASVHRGHSLRFSRRWLGTAAHESRGPTRSCCHHDR